MIAVLNVDDQQLTPCLSHRALREVNRNRVVWIDEQTIKLLYNPFSFPNYRKIALERDNYTCHWCGAPAMTVNHIVPSSKRGFTTSRKLARAHSMQAAWVNVTRSAGTDWPSRTVDGRIIEAVASP